MTGRKNKQPNTPHPRHSRRLPRYVSVRGLQREKADVSKLGRILEALMIAQGEAQAEADNASMIESTDTPAKADNIEVAGEDHG